MHETLTDMSWIGKKNSNVTGPSSASTENPVTNHTDTQEKWAILETEDESIGGGSWEVAIKQHHEKESSWKHHPRSFFSYLKKSDVHAIGNSLLRLCSHLGDLIKVLQSACQVQELGLLGKNLVITNQCLLDQSLAILYAFSMRKYLAFPHEIKTAMIDWHIVTCMWQSSVDWLPACSTTNHSGIGLLQQERTKKLTDEKICNFKIFWLMLVAINRRG